jgi:ATP-dependent exoDNAse (exonuclease V) alpha subunit
LAVGATVIVDEAGTLSTPHLAELARLADHHHWRIVLVGDPRQFSAVGRGGMFSHLTTTCGAIELDQVHRFTHQWERAASLRLRNADATVLVEYNRRGRLHDGAATDLESELMEAWRQARVRTRIADGELDPDGPSLTIGDYTLLVGDEVVTRHNQRRLRTDRGVIVKNRDHWRVTAIHHDRSVTVTGRSGTVRLPAGYVAEHVELGYAKTSHATQGRTVDTALLLVDAPTDTRGVYTPMTRGRLANHAYVVTDDTQTARDVLAQALSRDWIDHPALARRQQLVADQSAVPVWSSLQTARPDCTQQLLPRGARQEAGPAEPGPGEQSEHEQRVWRRLAQIQHRAAQQRSAERTVGRDTPGLER